MKKSLTGFTLIEIIIVIATIALTLPAFFAIIYAIFKQQTKVYTLNQAKKEGDFALNIMETLIRNSASGVYNGSSPIPGNQICSTPSGDQLTASYFKDRSEPAQWFRFFLKNSATIASESSVLNGGATGSTDLTSSKVKVSDFNLTCNFKSTFTTPIVAISFKIEYNTTSDQPEDKAVLNYQTKVKLREHFLLSDLVAPTPTPGGLGSTPLPDTYTFSFTDNAATNDITETSFYSFLSTFSPTSSWHMFFQEILSDGTDGAIFCTERGDWYRLMYLTYAPTSGTQTSGTWNKWEKISNNWTGPFTQSYTNTYGAACGAVCGVSYSWGPESDLVLLRLNPGSTTTEFVNTESALIGSTITIKFGSTRSVTCGF